MYKKLMILIALVFLIGCGQSEDRASIDQEKLSIEHKFAIVNAGHYLEPSDAVTIRSKELLDRSSKAYSETKESIADMAVKASKIIKAEGVDVTPMEVLEATTLAHNQNIKFPETAALYVSLRKGGQPHTEATIALKGILKCLNGSC